MRIPTVLAAVTAGLLFVGLPVQAQTEPIREGAFTLHERGAALGAWTLDLDAGRALAKARDLPLLLEFTGSDWCPACKQAQELVFTQPEWVTYASNRFVMVVVDFPRRTPQPDGVRERNDALARAYGVEGMPTFVFVAPDGTNKVAQFGLSQRATLYSFMRDASEALLEWPVYVDRFVAGMAPAQAAAYRQALSEYKTVEKEFAAWQETKPKNTPGNRKLLDSHQGRLMAAGTQLSMLGRERALAELDPAGAARQKALLAKTDRALERLELVRIARRDLEDWLLASPANTAENRLALERLLGRLETLQAESAALK